HGDREYIRVLYLHLTALGEEAKVRASTYTKAAVQNESPGGVPPTGSPGNPKSPVNPSVKVSLSSANPSIANKQQLNSSGRWLNRLLWIVAAAAILFLLMSLPHRPPASKTSAPRLPPAVPDPAPAFVSTFLVTKTTIAKYVDET